MIGTLFSLLALGGLYIGNAPARADKKKGDEAYRTLCQNAEAFNRNYAKEHNCFYNPYLGWNKNFYPDGSLKYDSLTGRNYPEGKYFCRSDGLMADYKRAGADVERPPK